MKSLKSNINAKRSDAVLVLNKLLRDDDGNPIGMYEDPNEPSSVNLGTPRNPERGKCYMGDNNGYVSYGEITELKILNMGIEFYINIPSTTSSNIIILSNSTLDDGGFLLSGYYLTYNITNRELSFIFWRSDTDPANTGSDVKFTVDLFDKWHKVKMLINSGSEFNFTNANVKLFVDNILIGTDIIYHTVGYDDNSVLDFRIGAYNRSNYPIPLSQNVKLFGFRVFNINLQTWKETNNIVFYKCDESYGTKSYDSSGNSYHGNIINALSTELYVDNENSWHNIQNIYSWQNEEGYGFQWFMNIKGEKYFQTYWPPYPTHQLSNWSIGPYNTSAFGQPYYLYQKQIGMESDFVWGVDYIPQVRNGYEMLKQNPEGVYLSNEGGLKRYIKDYNLNIKEYYFDVEARGGYFTLTLHSNNYFWEDFNDKINDIVSSVPLANNESNTVYDWYINQATDTEKAELDELIPLGTNNEVYTYADIYNNLAQSHKGNAISNWTNECFDYIHPINEVSYFEVLEEILVVNDTSVFPTIYQGKSLVGAIRSFEFIYYGDDSNGDYGVIKNIMFSQLGTNVMIPKDESIKLPPFKDVLGNDLFYIGKVPSIAHFKQSICYRGDGRSNIRLKYNYDSYKNLEINFKIKFGNKLDNRAIISRINRNTPTYNKSWYIYHTGGNTIIFEIYTYDSITNTWSTHKVSLLYEQNKWYEYSCKVYNGNISISDGINVNTATFSGEYAASTLNIYIGTKTSGYYQNNYYDLIYDIIFNELDYNGEYVSTLTHLPICEPSYKKGIGNIFNDISGNNNYAYSSMYDSGYGRQDEYHYLQNGFLIYNNGYIPILKDKSAFANGMPLDSPNAYLQDEHSFLNARSTVLKFYKYPMLEQADKDMNIWYDNIDKEYPAKLINHTILNAGYFKTNKIFFKS